MARGNHTTITNSEEDADLILNDEDPIADEAGELGMAPVVPLDDAPGDDVEAEPEF
jgi:hypothetical protein